MVIWSIWCFQDKVLSVISGNAKKPNEKRKVKRTSKPWQILVELIAFRKQNVSWYKRIKFLLFAL